MKTPSRTDHDDVAGASWSLSMTNVQARDIDVDKESCRSKTMKVDREVIVKKSTL